MNELELRNVKGTFDFLPKEMVVRNRITDILKKNFELFGYFPLETPIICYFDLLSSKYAGGDEILKEVYALTDQGNRELGLRYDLTVPFAKVIGMQKDLVLPFKRFEIGKVFRDGPVKPGRNREFYQCDIDVCGITSQTAEVEFFQLTNKVFEELNLDVEIHYNNRKFLVGILSELGIEEYNLNNVIIIIDKLLKVEEKELIKELNDLGIDNETINKLFDLFTKDYDYIKEYFKDTTNEYLMEGIKELDEINYYLPKLDLNNCLFKPSLARGLDIYTGTVWEIFSKDGYRSSLGGGGRYDKIITEFIKDGNIYPAVGMSFGLEPIYEVIKSKEEEKLPIDVLVYGFDLSPEILKIANQLRNENLKVIVEMNNSKLKKVLDYANKNLIPYVLIIGEDELKSGQLTLKDMFNSTQDSYLIDDIIKKIKNN